MVLSDALSRCSDHVTEDDKEERIVFPKEVFIDATRVEIHDEELLEQIWTTGTNDGLLGTTVKALKEGKIPPLRSAVTDWHEDNGLLWYKGRLYVPDDLELRRKIVWQHHDSIPAGHPGHRSTHLAVFRTFWWPRMAVFVKNYVDGCVQCQQFKVNTHPMLPPMMPIKADHDALLFSTVSMDFITDLPESNEYTALYVVVDHNLSKGIVLVPCTKEETSVSTAAMYHDHVYKRFGLPRAMISDRGPQFASKVFQELCTRLGV